MIFLSQELAKYYVQIIPSAKGIGGDIVDEIDGDDIGKKSGKSIVGGIMTVFAVSKLADGLMKALDIGGALQQSMGGVQALLGEETFGKVNEYAQKAAQTLQISANTYMEQVTSFSGKLLQDLGGDTEAVAAYADMAINSMSDNANKMGTSIESIQNAYQGFAKGNFTMLDNLKLGYGGTKTEMLRLLEDAEKIKAANGEMVEYSIDNFADMVEAIRVVQENMGIAGTSATEAESTITGSMNSLKAAWENFVANMTLGEDMQPALDALFTTFMNTFNNIVPAALNIISKLPGTILDFIIQAAPTLIEAGMTAIVELITGLSNSLPTLIPKMIEAVGLMFTTLVNNAPKLISAGLQLVGALVGGLVKSIPQFVQTGFDMLMGLARGIGNSIGAVVQRAKEAASKVLNSVKSFFGIHSPSKVFANIGEMNMLGLAKGIEDNLRPVNKAMEDVSMAATQDFNSNLNLASNVVGLHGYEPENGSSTNYGGVTINVYGEDKSVTEIAEAVNDILQTQIMLNRRVYQ